MPTSLRELHAAIKDARHLKESILKEMFQDFKSRQPECKGFARISRNAGIVKLSAISASEDAVLDPMFYNFQIQIEELFKVFFNKSTDLNNLLKKCSALYQAKGDKYNYRKIKNIAGMPVHPELYEFVRGCLEKFIPIDILEEKPEVK